MGTDCKRAVSKPCCRDLQFCVVFLHAEMCRNETLKNLSRETVKRASVHEMLFSFCATYSPELPLSFSMKPVPRRVCPLRHVHSSSASLKLVVCNGLSNPVKKASRKESGLLARIIVASRCCRRHFPFISRDSSKWHNENFTSSAICLITLSQNRSTRWIMCFSEGKCCSAEVKKVILSRGFAGNITSSDARYVLTFLRRDFPFFKVAKQ